MNQGDYTRQEAGQDLQNRLEAKKWQERQDRAEARRQANQLI